MGTRGSIKTSEHAREMQRKSAESRKNNNKLRKTLKYTLNVLMSKALKKGEFVSAEEIQNMAEVEGMNIDIQTAMSVAIIQKALLGDVQAAQFIRDTLGEKPSDKVELDQSLTIESWAKNHEVKL